MEIHYDHIKLRPLLANLTHLTLKKTALRNIEPLAYCVTLSYLNLSYNFDCSMDPLLGLPL